MFDAGIVTFVPRGDWVNNVTYYPLNIVNYDGLSWIARRENIGQTPADGQYWQPNGTAVPIATTTVAGKVMPDGTSITVDQQGHISAAFSADLDDLDNVSITSPSNNQVLKYNASSQEWENGTDTGGLIPHLIIISETGSTVTVSKGLWSTTATETSTGHFECDVPEFGTYTIDAVLGGDDAQVSLVVDAVKIYTVDDSHFHADITVTYPTGATVSCSKTGEATMYATGSPYTFTVHSSGTWTITCAVDGNTYTANVVISTSGQTETLTLPTGSTVTPTDDVKTLVHCAGLSASEIDTLADLLADSTSLLAVTSSNNAVDYLVRSTTFATDVCADSTAMTDIGANEYCARTLLDDSTWRPLICNSTYFESVLNVKVPTMTSDTTPSGECFANSTRSGTPLRSAFDKNNSTYWQPYEQYASQATASGFYVGYHFDNAVIVNKAKVTPLSGGSNYLSNTVIKFQASNDRNTWVDLTGNLNWSNFAEEWEQIIANNTAYTDYRLYFVSQKVIYQTTSYVGDVAELQFWGREDV